MTSGKKNYFRHSFFAHEDEKCQALISEKGFDAYGKWWVLIEILARQCENEVKESFRVHISLLRSCWRSNDKYVRTFLQVLDKFELVSCHIDGNIVHLEIPNLSKYLGRYQDKNQTKPPNKIKEKEIKGNKKKGKIINPSGVFDAWNLICGDKLPKAKVLTKKRIGQIDATSKIIEGLQILPGWNFYFEKCKKIPFLCGANDRNWKCDFDWVINSNNALKIAEGRYDQLGSGGNSDYLKKLHDENPYRSKKNE